MPINPQTGRYYFLSQEPQSETRRERLLREQEERQDPGVSRQEVPRGTLGSIMKGLRTLQQYTTIGPALAIQERVQEGTPLTLGSIARSGREASRDDLSFRDVAERGGLEGWKATALGLGGDLLLDPLNFIAPLKVASMAGRAARLPQAAKAVGLDRALAAAKGTGAAKYLGKHFVTDYGKPQVFIDRQDDYIRELSRRQDETAALAKKLSGFSAEDQRVMKEWIEAPYSAEPIGHFERTLYGGGHLGSTPAIRDKILEGASAGLKTTTRRGDNILDVSREIRDAGMNQYREGIEAGIFKDPSMPKPINPKTGKLMPVDDKTNLALPGGTIPKFRDDLEGRYVHRMWKEIEEQSKDNRSLAALADNVGGWMDKTIHKVQPPKMTKAMTGTTKARQDLENIDLTPIGEIGPGFVKGHALTGRLLETRKFLNDIVSQKITKDIPEEFVNEAGTIILPAKFEKYKKARGLQDIPNTPIYGPLKGKLVPEAVHEDIVGAVGLGGNGNRVWAGGNTGKLS